MLNLQTTTAVQLSVMGEFKCMVTGLLKYCMNIKTKLKLHSTNKLKL